MNRSEVIALTSSIDQLVEHANRFAPEGKRGVADFRAELGGVVTVLVASCYENIVKQVLIDYSSRHHIEFGRFTESSFARLNSRIQLRDLHKLCKHGGPSISESFRRRLNDRKVRYRSMSKTEMEKSYERILAWRHDYAHAGIKNTSLVEAVKTHREGFPVLLSFSEAFEEFSP